MKNYRAILGLSDSAGAEEIKKAYRKLAMKHHPDRGGNEEVFKSMKEAYEELEKTGFAPYRQPSRPGPNPGWAKPEPPSGTWQAKPDPSIDDILDQMKAFRRGGPIPRNPNYVQPNADVIMQVPIRDAARGFEWRISRQKQNGFVEHLDVVVPGGLPDGHRGRYTLSDGSTQVLIMKIDPGKFRIRGLANSVGTIFEAGITTGDVELDVNIDALDLITGTWIEVEDYNGERLTVRVPAGFNPDQRLKVAGKGYFGWLEDQQAVARFRRDMYIKLRPIFNTPDKIDRKKILNLYNTVGGWEEQNGETSN